MHYLFEEQLLRSRIRGFADAIQIVSHILRQGPESLYALLADFRLWMEANLYKDIGQLRGVASFLNVDHPEAHARASYFQLLKNWKP